MQRQLVNSSDLESVGYDPTSLILEIEFKNGNIYHYSGVPLSIYQGLMAAYSKGRFFNDYVKDIYSYRKVY